MKQILSLTAVVASAVSAVAAQQQPFAYPWSSSATSAPNPDSYKFKWPVKRVAVIGTGVGGLIAYRELTENGYEVDIYERDNLPGGNWHYTDETPVDAPIPNAPIAVGDFVPSLPPDGVKLPYTEEYEEGHVAQQYRRVHRAPKPVWASLKSNAPAPIQQIRETPWPKGTEWELPHAKLARYIRAFASWHGVNANDGNPHAFYNTRVEHVERSETGWSLLSKELVKTEANTTRATWNKRHYDAVVVATGRYNAPNVPAIVGLEQWNERFPGKITHARAYRRPEEFKDKTVLVIGAATSGGEIAREVIQHAKQVYVSVRPDRFRGPHFPLDVFLRRLPPNITLIGEIKTCSDPGSGIETSEIHLVNGTVFSGVDHIILGTGYRYTYPFLPQYVNSSLGTNGTLPREEGYTQPLITDGTHIRSLYLDAFYIPDPTLLFINANFGMQSFTFAEFVSLAAAKVWAGKADFPNTAALWEWYDKAVVDRLGYGRQFQFYGAERTQAALRFFVGWLNEAATKYGGRQIDNLPADNAEVSKIWVSARFANPDHGSNFPSNLVPVVTPDIKVDGSEAWAQDWVYSDWW
ncbi:hypothetical protein EST38_g2289 [Candolleomyces aberdarensis]|uniref:FAD/NAD(P)-binding domain-containing protein n=1 Tax=Candolleomyces aberdarensis TaxID=2316362 RepID=A0A4Q2DTW7_9AGAR|nr:hypothetical protein EST38_g2289 [Candolleomyces aberdarensis]